MPRSPRTSAGYYKGDLVPPLAGLAPASRRELQDAMSGRLFRTPHPDPLPARGEGVPTTLCTSRTGSASPLEGRGREERAGEGWFVAKPRRSSQSGRPGETATPEEYTSVVMALLHTEAILSPEGT